MYEVFEKLLKLRGVTAYAVSQATGVSPATFTDWKTGRSKPKAEKLQKIADYFGVSIEYLTTGKNKAGYYLDDDVADLAQEIFERPQLKILFDASRELSIEDLEAVTHIVNAMYKKEHPEE